MFMILALSFRVWGLKPQLLEVPQGTIRRAREAQGGGFGV